MPSRRHDLPILAMFVGLTLPFATWAWAKAIDERLVFEDLPDPVLLAFNGIAFALFAGASLRLPRSASAGGLLALVAISVHLHMSYWQSHSSTTALLFLFYLPWAFGVALAGIAVGYACGKLRDASPRAGEALTAILLLAFGAGNLWLSRYGRFNLPAETGVDRSDAPRIDLEKTAFFTTEERLGALTSIEMRPCSDDPEAVLTLTGRGGAALVTAAGELRRFVRFDEVAGFDVFPVDADGDGACEFVDRAGGWQPIGLIDSEGRYVFRYGKNMTVTRPEKLVEIEHSPTDVVPFDLGSDGRLELLVPLLIVGREETHVLDALGRRLRVLPENLEGSRAFDGKLYTPRRGKLLIRDAGLRTLAEIPLGRGAPSWAFVRWPDFRGRFHLAIQEGDGVRVLDLGDGSEKASIEASAGDVLFLDGRVVSSHQENRRQFLGVFDADGRSVYEEVLHLGGTLVALTEESFLISECPQGRCPVVWRYRLP
jgi:hypothetical protein